MRRLLFLLSLSLSACGEGQVKDCACKVSIGEETLELECGAQGCVAGSSFGCDDDNVVPLGLCIAPDMAGAGSCVPPQAICDPAGTACCATADGGTAPLGCDPVSRHCCAAVGAPCETSADCCPDHVCAAASDGKRCA